MRHRQERLHPSTAIYFIFRGTNKWQRLGADLKYFFSSKVGVGLGYWFEKFEVADFATIDLPGASGTPRIDNLGEIGSGYGNRPYKGQTGFVRLLYQF